MHEKMTCETLPIPVINQNFHLFRYGLVLALECNLEQEQVRAFLENLQAPERWTNNDDDDYDDIFE